MNYIHLLRNSTGSLSFNHPNIQPFWSNPDSILRDMEL